MTNTDYSVEGPIGQALIEKQDRDPKWWADMARDVFGLPLRDAKLLMIEGVLEKIEETDLVVEGRFFHIGSGGTYWVEVES